MYFPLTLKAIGSPDVTLEAITLTFGNTTLDYAHGNINRLAHALDVAKKEGSIKNPTMLERIENGVHGKPIPIGLGAEKPLGGRLFTASYFHGRDGMSGVSFLEGNPYPESTDSKLFSTKPSELPAADLILEVLKTHEPNTVRIAAVAPLTNLALAYQKDPATFRRVHSISVMGGALDVPGNVCLSCKLTSQTTPCAEFNFFADPWAAKLLIEQAPREGPPLPIHLLPLDVTTIHTIPYSKLVLNEDDALYKNSYLVRLISLFLRKPRSVTNSFAPKGLPFDPDKYDLFECHDPLAVAHAMYHGIHEGWSSTPRPFLIESEGELTRGFCVVEYVYAINVSVAAVTGISTLGAARRMSKRSVALKMSTAWLTVLRCGRSRWPKSRCLRCPTFLRSPRRLARSGSKSCYCAAST